jgi:tRNA (guanine-N7-)-methyltransferase
MIVAVGHIAKGSAKPAMSRSRSVIDFSSHLIEPVPPDIAEPIDWRALFENDRPVEVEIGSGKGLFLASAAGSDTARNFFGIELSRKYATVAAARLKLCDCRNAKVMRADARLVMSRLVPTASLAAVHVYFPDPWWKKRHKKRRVMTESLVADIERTLIPGGELRVASDVQEYFSVIRALIAARPSFLEQEVPAPRTPEHDLDYLTSFERKYRLEGRSIYRAHYLLS